MAPHTDSEEEEEEEDSEPIQVKRGGGFKILGGPPSQNAPPPPQQQQQQVHHQTSHHHESETESESLSAPIRQPGAKIITNASPQAQSVPQQPKEQPRPQHVEPPKHQEPPRHENPMAQNPHPTPHPPAHSPAPVSSNPHGNPGQHPAQVQQSNPAQGVRFASAPGVATGDHEISKTYTPTGLTTAASQAQWRPEDTNVAAVHPWQDNEAPGKRKVKEFVPKTDTEEKVIVPPTFTQAPGHTMAKVQWPPAREEMQKDPGAPTRAKCTEFVPNNPAYEGGIPGEAIFSKTGVGRSPKMWPPPEEERPEKPNPKFKTKLHGDDEWKKEDEAGLVGQGAGVWALSHPTKINQVWPPPEQENQPQDLGPLRRRKVVWPPPDFEHEVQKGWHATGGTVPVNPPVKGAQWPPPEPMQEESPMAPVPKIKNSKMREQWPPAQDDYIEDFFHPHHKAPTRIHAQWPPPEPEYFIVNGTGAGPDDHNFPPQPPPKPSRH